MPKPPDSKTPMPIPDLGMMDDREDLLDRRDQQERDRITHEAEAVRLFRKVIQAARSEVSPHVIVNSDGELVLPLHVQVEKSKLDRLAELATQMREIKARYGNVVPDQIISPN